MVKTLSPGLQKLKKTNPKVVEKMGFKKGGKVRTSYAGGGDTHVTKDGRTVQKGLYYNINQSKKKGTSKPGKGSVTDKALAQAKKTAFKKTT